MTEVRQKAAVVALDASLAYVLTSINVADDYFKEKAYCAELEGRLLGMTARAKELSEKLAAKEAEEGNGSRGSRIWRTGSRFPKKQEKQRKINWIVI